MPRDDGLPPGTLAMLILRVLASQPLHGYAIAQKIGQLSRDELSVEEGSLYPALQKLLLKGWVKAAPAISGKWAVGARVPADSERPAAARDRAQQLPARDAGDYRHPGDGIAMKIEKDGGPERSGLRQIIEP